MNFIEELTWRGLIHDIMPGTEEELAKGMTSAYIGFDPTADSLHIGNLVPVMLLTHFQRSGHKPFVLVGGATGLVGDPSGKTQERQLLDKQQIQHNLNCQTQQLRRFLNFDSGENAAEVVNNYDWFKELNFLDFIRDVGKHITINYMLAKDSVKNRLETGMSFTEFSYQLIQGYDFYYLNKSKNCKLQMGGSDQWGNITTGTELIRRMGGGDAFALTAPLIRKADGSKFGKSEGGNVWLDAEKTSPYKFYQFWINASDEDIKGFIRIFSLKTKEEIEGIKKEHEAAPHTRALQKALATEITERVHGADNLQLAIEASDILFGRSTAESLRKLSEADFLDIFSGVEQARVKRTGLGEGLDIVEVVSELCCFLPSKSEARRALKENSLSMNKEKVEEGRLVRVDDLINDKYLLLQRGKKNYFLLVVE